MAKKRKTTRKKKTQNRKKKKSLLKLWFIQLIVIMACVCLSYCVWLDFQIRKEFEGKRWSVPARVYAQPVELYVGKKISQKQLINKLSEANYEPVKTLGKQGQFNSYASLISIYTRQFHYWDSYEKARKIQIQINNGVISQIKLLDKGGNIQIVRLSPELIGKIFPLHDEDRVLIKYESIPQSLIKALIAVEDRNFYEHYGIDPIGIIRSVITNLLAGKIKQGGSTLTQQLIKNMFLTRERTYSRKINEMIMALMLEYHYSKESILAAYVNEVYLGQNGARSIHGFGTAAEFYFSKPLKELNIAEVSLLVGLVKGASYYNPRKHPERALKRRNLVLNLLNEQEFITSVEMQRASAIP